MEPSNFHGSFSKDVVYSLTFFGCLLIIFLNLSRTGFNIKVHSHVLEKLLQEHYCTLYLVRLSANICLRLVPIPYSLGCKSSKCLNIVCDSGGIFFVA